MSYFLGTHQNRLDAKGRVSVPASFRAQLRTLAGSVSPSMVLRPSGKFTCIEAWPMPQFQELATALEQLDMFSEAHDDMAADLYADACPIDPDREGRIILPESLVAHANLTDTVVFMGLGQTFQIWEPGAAARRRDEVRKKSPNLTLPGKLARRAAPATET